MDDTIYRQAAIDAIEKVDDYGDGIAFEVLSHAQRNISLLPSAERRGRWERKGYHLHCSCCDWSTDLATPYCPGCGAYLGGDAK